MKYKLIVSLLIIGLCLSFSSCSTMEKLFSKYHYSITRTEAEEIVLRFVNAIESRDISTISNLFANKVKNSTDFKKQVSEFLEFYQGTMVSHSDYTFVINKKISPHIDHQILSLHLILPQQLINTGLQ